MKIHTLVLLFHRLKLPTFLPSLLFFTSLLNTISPVKYIRTPTNYFCTKILIGYVFEILILVSNPLFYVPLSSSIFSSITNLFYCPSVIISNLRKIIIIKRMKRTPFKRKRTLYSSLPFSCQVVPSHLLLLSPTSLARVVVGVACPWTEACVLNKQVLKFPHAQTRVIQDRLFLIRLNISICLNII